MAFFVGEQRVPEQITRADWQALAHALGMPPRPFLARLEQLVESLPDHASSARRAFAERFGDEPVYDYLEESVRRRCHWTLNSVFTGKSSPVPRPRH
jgi:hypothetical protein